MPATWKKETMPAVLNPKGGHDGFDRKALYQMVPHQGKRWIGVFSDGPVYKVASEDPRVAFLVQQPDGPKQEVVVKGHGTWWFEIVGKQSGFTPIQIRGPNGEFEASLSVSVKPKLTKTYSLVLLRDPIHKSGFAAADVAAVMKQVADVFLQQANLELKPHGTGDVIEAVARNNLGNPLFGFRPDINKQITAATPASALGADVVVYCSWNVASVDSGSWPLGMTFGKTCFVEKLAKPTSDKEQMLVFAHEVGHALGLADSKDDATCLMHKVTNPKLSTKLTRAEIDRINSGGRVVVR